MTGCSAPAEQAAEGGDISGKVTYAFWDENQKSAIEDMVAAFNKKYPDVEVTLQTLPWSQYWTTLQTQASSNTLPDVFWMNMPNFKLYATNDQLAPMTDATLSGEVDVKNYPATLTDFYKVDGKQYAVPKDADTTAVWINTELFERAGVELPQPDWTWEDFRQTAKDITTKLGSEGVYGLGYYPYGQSMYYNGVYQAGGYVISPDGKKSGWDTPEGKAGLQFWVDMIKDGSTPSIEQLTETSGDQWFLSNKLAMYPQVAGSTAKPFGESGGPYKVVPLPTGKTQANIGHALANVVAAKSKNLAAAQALQAFLAGEEAQLIQSESGVAISAYTGTESAFVESFPDLDLQVFIDALDYTVPYPSSKNTPAWASSESEILTKVWGGTLSVDEATTQLSDIMNDALAKE